MDRINLYSPCTSLKRPSEIVRVGFSTRTKFGGGFGGTGGGLFNRSSSNGFATTSIITKTTPRTTKTTRQFSSCGKSYPCFFWGMPVIKCRDYTICDLSPITYLRPNSDVRVVLKSVLSHNYISKKT